VKEYSAVVTGGCGDLRIGGLAGIAVRKHSGCYWGLTLLFILSSAGKACARKIETGERLCGNTMVCTGV
jgi:hypothetical protein